MMGDENEGFKGTQKKKSIQEVQNSTNSSNFSRVQPRVFEGINPAKKMVNSENNLSSGSNRDGLSGNGGFLRQVTRVRISLSMKSKLEARELKRKLEIERDMVRSLMRRIDANEAQQKALVFDNLGGNNVGPPRMSKPLNQLSVSVFENTKSGYENVDKVKKTPKEKPLYMNSEILLAKKDNFPLSENNKKSKSRSKNKQGRGSQLAPTGKFPNPVLKKCKAILERLMKHKHGWIFNKPVDVAGLGLHDYFQIIKNPMDLGTVKKRLTQNWYETPLLFAEDVRLTFRNAMTYNPIGHGVYVIAEDLSKIFEEKWAPLEADYMREFNNADVGLPMTREAPPQPDMKKGLDKEQNITLSNEISVPKKPKEDTKKREMTYDEKQKLSIDLQDLPSEELATVVEIIRNRTTSITQEDDEIEIDIDTIDNETLWELDRFISNYKRSLSKNEKDSEIFSQFVTDSEQITKEKIPTSVVTETAKGSRADVERVVSPLVQVKESEANNVNQEASQSSSGNDSGSSSSDSEGESSSGDGSDGGKSPIIESWKPLRCAMRYSREAFAHECAIRL
ncbi:hypothetical protein RD792_006314 [Penstemon davidsonii]|uniref:Transcription factor GTE4 n=1 Tax=Penstemon davidsonii TaxID=160366 RepID=A0ABR0DCM6_9LAMI|nr:hypothetical protein RD792_006314 [Penstemon davidsonii]